MVKTIMLENQNKTYNNTKQFQKLYQQRTQGKLKVDKRHTSKANWIV